MIFVSLLLALLAAGLQIQATSMLNVSMSWDKNKERTRWQIIASLIFFASIVSTCFAIGLAI